MGLNLEDLRAPLEEVKFLSGTRIVPVPFGASEYALWRSIQVEIAKDAPDRTKIGTMAMEIIRACYPGVTDDDLLDCNSDMLMALTAYPGGKIDMVRAALKNAAAVEQEQAVAAPPEKPATTPLSSPKKNGSTSASRSRKRAAKTSSTSTSADPTDGQSSSGTGTTDSKSVSESTPYSVKWTPSTAPA